MPKPASPQDVAVFKVWINAIPEGERRRPYRLIAMPQDADLYELAFQINKAFDFGFDHAFGFFDDLKHPYRSKLRYELFQDLGADGGMLEASGALLKASGLPEAQVAVIQALHKVDMQALQQEIELELRELVLSHGLKRFEDAILPHVPVRHHDQARQVIRVMAEEAFQADSDDSSLVTEGEFGVKDVPILTAFSALRPRMCYLFDYGDDWMFEVSFVGLRAREARARYPKVLESKGKAPEQYPDWDEA